MKLSYTITNNSRNTRRSISIVCNNRKDVLVFIEKLALVNNMHPDTEFNNIRLCIEYKHSKRKYNNMKSYYDLYRLHKMISDMEGVKW